MEITTEKEANATSSHEPEEDIIRKRKEQLKRLLMKKNLLALLGLVILIAIAWQIRTANLPILKDSTTGDFTLGPDLDPFLFLRYSEIIINNGSLPPIDNMRYVPIGFNTEHETQVLPYMMAYFYKALLIINPSATINYSGALFPAVMFIFTVLAFWLLARKIFEDHKYKEIIGFIATFAFIVAPSILSRTIAGIPEKESAGFVFMFLAFYFFLYGWRTESKKKAIATSILSGLSTALMGMIWGGWVYIPTTIALFALFSYLFGKIGRKEMVVYGLWIMISVIILWLLFKRYSLMSLVLSNSAGFAIMIFLLILTEYVLFSTKLKEKPVVKRAEEKYSKKGVSIVVFIVLILVLSTVLVGINFIPDFVKDIVDHLIRPYTERHALTVAENRQPYFNEWKSSFGPMISNQALGFWIFFIGSIFLLFEALKRIDWKRKLILISSYTFFISSIIFSRIAENSTMNGETSLAKLFFVGGMLVILASFVYVFFRSFKEKKLESLKEINFSYIFLISFFIVSLLGARSAVRLVMALDPAASLLIGYFAIAVLTIAMGSKEETKRLLAYTAAILLIIATIYTLIGNPLSLALGLDNFMGGKGNLQVTYNQAKNFGTNSYYTQQWQKAMSWVRENTPADAVFAHWWDYGYWLQSIGKRPTVLDGGNAVGYWNYLIARTVLTGSDTKTAQEFLYSHNVSYLLIDSSDIGKYPAYASIGSDENYDKYSWISTFEQEPEATQELQNQTVMMFTMPIRQNGAVVGHRFSPLDQDYEYRNNGSVKMLPSGVTGIVGIKVSFAKDNSVKSANVLFIYNGQQFLAPLRCVYFENKTYSFDVEGYNGCLYIIPSLINNNGQLGMNRYGAGIFLSERIKETNFAKLFLFGKEEGFKLAHKEDDLFIRSLKDQGNLKEHQDFIYDNAYGRGIVGPIKIWQPVYPSDIKINPEYLQTDYPESVKRARK